MTFILYEIISFPLKEELESTKMWLKITIRELKGIMFNKYIV